MNVWVNVVVRFAAVGPDDEIAADDWADSIADAIVTAVERSDDTIEKGSASVIDWTQEVVR